MPITLVNIRNDIRANLQANQQELSDATLMSFINQAIGFGESKSLLIPVADETLVVATDTYEYPFTGGELANLKYIHEIWQEGDTANVFDDYIPRNYWSIEYSSTPYLYFYPSIFPGKAVTDRLLRVKGFKPQARVVDDDTDTIDLPGMFVVWKASALGHAALSSSINRRGEWHRSQVQYSEQQAEDIRLGSREFKLPPNCRKVPGRGVN